MSPMPTYGVFAQHIGSEFALAAPTGTLALTLASADRHTAPRGYESFTLLFRGPSDRYLPQATYRLGHAVLGQLDLFLVPVRQDAQGFDYEAVFNIAVDEVDA